MGRGQETEMCAYMWDTSRHPGLGELHPEKVRLGG